MKKLISLLAAAAMVLAAVPAPAQEEYKTRHVYDGYGPVYETTKEKYHTRETEHFQIFWGDSGEAAKVTEDFLKNCDRVLENCWNKFVVEMGMTPPTTSNAPNGDHETQYKINVILNETGVEGYGGWAFGGIDREGYPYFMCAPDAMSDWVVPHEMGHVMHFAQGRNAWEGNNYLGPWYEAIGNWFREQYLYDKKCFPSGENYSTDLSALYLRAGSLMAVNGRGYYEAWPLLQYLTDNPDGLDDFGKNFVAQLLGYHPKADMGFYDVLANNTNNDVRDVIGYFASHMATMDFEQKKNYNLKINEMLNNGWLFWQQRYTEAERTGDGFTVPWERTPQGYGYNIIPLSGVGEVSATLKGLTDIERAGWRARLVVEGKNGKTRYSELFGNGETGTVNVEQDEEVYLTVAATPTLESALKLGLGGWAGFEEASFPFESKPRYPYSFTLKNASPLGRPEPTVKGHFHENGGGFVADTATVAASAYVGPEARVLGQAKVSENAVIDGQAIVSEWAQVNGNAYVGGRAVVMGAARIGGSARVLESALVYGNYTVEGNAVVKGQAILLGAGVASGQAIAYGDLFEDESKTILAGAFSGYHSVNTNLGYASKIGETETYVRPLADRLQINFDFDSMEDSVGRSGLFGVKAPEFKDGRVFFDGTEKYVLISPSALSYENAEVRLNLKYESGTALGIGGLSLTSDAGRPALRFGNRSVVLDSPYGEGDAEVCLKFFGDTVSLCANGEEKSLDLGESLWKLADSGAWLGRGVVGDYFRGEIDSLRVYLYDGTNQGIGEAPAQAAEVFAASGEERALSSLTADNSSPWCGWAASDGAAAAGEGLTVPAGGSLTITSPNYGRDCFVLEFSPSGDAVYPDHAIIDGSGKCIFAHRFASDANRIYPGRGEQSFAGEGAVTDTAAQKRLAGFAAEAVFLGSSLMERGAAEYMDGDIIRIVVENTEYGDGLKRLFERAANRSAKLASLSEGDEVYTVTYAIVRGGATIPISSSLYIGKAEGFGGIRSFGTWAGKSVRYGGLRVLADGVALSFSALENGVLVTGGEGGTVIFASGDENRFATASVNGALTRFAALPEGFSKEAEAFLWSDIKELRPLALPVSIREVFVSSVGQNASAFHRFDEKRGRAVFTLDFVDNGSKSSGILLGASSALNERAGNYFAAASVCVLFGEGTIFKRSASDGDKVEIGKYEVGARIPLRIEADIENGTYDLYVNGALAGENIAFRTAAESLDTLALVENNGGAAFNVFGFKAE